MDLVAVPPSLPLLRLNNRVLLPTSFARIQFPAAGKHSSSNALLDHLASLAASATPANGAGDDKQIIIAVLPAFSGKQEEGDLAESAWGLLGTAARVLQLTRVVQTGERVLVLEGLCRISITSTHQHPRSNHSHSHSQPHTASHPYELAHAAQLEMRPLGSPPPLNLPPLSHTSSATDARLGLQLKAVTHALLKLLSKHAHAGPLPSPQKVLELLDAVPAWRAADIVAAALSSTQEERLSVLHAVEHRQRIKLALQLARQALDAARQGIVAASGAGSSPRLRAASGSGAGRSGGAGGSGQPGGESAAAGDGDQDSDEDDLEVLMQRMQQAGPPPEVWKAAQKELRRLQQMGHQSPGYASARAYLEVLSELPWSRLSSDVAREQQEQQQQQQQQQQQEEAGAEASGQELAPVPSPGPGPGPGPMTLKRARLLLDSQHYGLDKIKDRVVEHLAVLRLKGSSARAPILCFIGPPGTGKTSLARSVAHVLRRPLVRIALGGVRDEAEVRGHRRTYVGAIPGRIIQGLRRVGVSDPVMLLDEVDKLGRDSLRGDPASTLLEVLDPEQNPHFTDTYLGLPVDLSRVTFIATANKAADIPPALFDRLEVITLSGYTQEEKVHIAKVHLLPKLLEEHGLGPGNMKLEEDIVEHIASSYTREAGVRSLSRCLAAICRHVAVSIVTANDDEDQGQGQGQIQGAMQQQQQQQQQLPAGEGGLAAAAASQGCSSASDAASGQLPGGGSNFHTSGSSRELRAAAPASAAAASQLLSSSFPNAPVAAARAGGAAAAAATTSFYGSGDLVSRHLSPSLCAATTLPSTPHALGGRNTSTTVAAASSSRAKDAGTAAPPPRNWLSRMLLSALTTSSPAPAAAASDEDMPSSGHWMRGPPAPPRSLEAFGPTRGSRTYTPTSASLRSAAGAGAGAGAGAAAGSRSINSAMRLALGPDPGHPPTPYPPDLLGPSQDISVVVTRSLVEAVLGPVKFSSSEAIERVSSPGTAAGLVWTAVGGSVQYIECARIGSGTPNKPGALTLTGQLGEVLGESARIALSWILSHSLELGLQPAQQEALAATAAGAAAAVRPGWGPAVSEPLGDGPEAVPELMAPELLHGLDAAAGKLLAAGVGIGGLGSAAQPLTLPDPAVGPARQRGGSRTPAQLSASSSGGGGCDSSCSSSPVNWDIHIHLPAGGIPKDGPSAGITLAVALLSLLSGRRVRADTAMTGELTLRGLVLPVGGLKEKLLAARHAGLTRVIVPRRNLREVELELPSWARSSLQVVPVERVEEVLLEAFDPPYHMQGRARM